VGLVLGCVNIGVFACERDSQCELDGRVGQCFDPGYCALPDEACESGYRFDDRSVPDDLAGRCAPMEDGSSTGTSTTGGSSSSSSGLGTSTGGSSSEEGSSTTGHDCGDHPCGCTASLSVGTNHVCVARFDGEVICWGSNGYAELGMGRASAPIPWPQWVDIPGASGVLEVFDGNNHTCGLTQDESVYCWGRNASGEIDPALVEDLVIAPTALPLLEPPGAIGMGPQHTCVSSPVGPGVRCLGNNTNGKLGGPNPDPVDTMLPGMQAIEQMSLGRDHTCAMAGGQVWCWGRNNYGQLGDPMIMVSTPDPTEVVLPAPATMIAGGRDHTCVVLEGEVDEVLCWGRNNVGQIGDGTQALRNVPTALVEPLPSAVVGLSGRLDTSCALLEDGDLWCWGGLYGVELGTAIEPEMELRVPMRVEVVDELPEPIVEAEVGASHLCARAESGRLWCWGRDNLDQLGPIAPPLGMTAVEIDVECPPGVGN